MAIDLDDLERKALAATAAIDTHGWYMIGDTAEVTLALIERVRTAERERDALRPVVEAAESWREMRYPRSRSWKADCDEDMHLVSAVDTYRASKEGGR